MTINHKTTLDKQYKKKIIEEYDSNVFAQQLNISHGLQGELSLWKREIELFISTTA